jgi:hypothetical protein
MSARAEYLLAPRFDDVDVIIACAPAYLWTTYFRSFSDVRGLLDQDDDPELSKYITYYFPAAPRARRARAARSRYFA